MRLIKQANFLFFITMTLCLLSSCEYTPTKGKGGNRTLPKEWLTFQYEQQIAPAFYEYAKATDQMKEAAIAYEKANAEQEPATEEALKKAFVHAFMQLQDVIIYDRPIFVDGKNELYEMTGTTNVDKKNIQTIINEQSTFDELKKNVIEEIYLPNQTGYSTIDYILYSNEIEKNKDTKVYLRNVCQLQQELAHQILEYWKKEKSRFVLNNDFSATGTFSGIVNHFMQYYERNIRTKKVGTPLGIYGLSLIPKPVNPSSVEGYYHGGNLSTELLKRAMKSVNNFYEGVPYYETTRNEIQGKNGFKEICSKYMSASKKADIINLLNEHIQQTVNETNQINQGIQELIVTPEGKKIIDKEYNSLQQIVGIIKAKAIGALGLTVTYTDGEEGD